MIHMYTNTHVHSRCTAVYGQCTRRVLGGVHGHFRPLYTTRIHVYMHGCVHVYTYTAMYGPCTRSSRAVLAHIHGRVHDGPCTRRCIRPMYTAVYGPRTLAVYMASRCITTILFAKGTIMLKGTYMLKAINALRSICKQKEQLALLVRHCEGQQNYVQCS